MHNIKKLEDIKVKLTELKKLIPNMMLVGSIALMLHAIEKIKLEHEEKEKLTELVNKYLEDDKYDFDIVSEISYNSATNHKDKLKELDKAGYKPDTKLNIDEYIESLSNGSIKNGIKLINEEKGINIDYIGLIMGLHNKKKPASGQSITPLNFKFDDSLSVNVEGLGCLGYSSSYNGDNKRTKIKADIMKILTEDTTTQGFSCRKRLFFGNNESNNELPMPVKRRLFASNNNLNPSSGLNASPPPKRRRTSSSGGFRKTKSKRKSKSKQTKRKLNKHKKTVKSKSKSKSKGKSRK